jgi:hypothetical protein
MAYPEVLPAVHLVGDPAHTTGHNVLRTAVGNIDTRLHTVETGGVTGPTGPVGLVWRGTYSAVATYGANDAVYNPADGMAYIAVAGTTANAPPNATYWAVLAGAANSFDRDRATGGTSGLWEVFPASAMNNGTFTLVSGTQYWTYFYALTTTISKMRFTVGTASTTTTHAWTAIHALNANKEPTTQLAAATDLTTFATNTASMYSAGATNNEFTIAVSGLTVGALYAAAVLWTGTGTPAVRGRTIDGSTGVGGGWSAYAGTYFASKHSATGLAALATGNPVTTAANLAANATGIQMGIGFIP